MRTDLYILRKTMTSVIGFILVLGVVISCKPKVKPDAILLGKAIKGDVESMYSLANWYLSQKQNDDYIDWLTKAAEQGYAAAQYDLAVSYDEGDGIREDKAKAVKWYKEAINNGDEDAPYNLALMYDLGDYVKEDKATAFQYYQLAAERGHIKAMHNVGVAYYEGEGVGQDKNEALKWFKKAAENGEERSIHNYQVLCEELNINNDLLQPPSQ